MRTPILLVSAHAYMHNCLAIAMRPQCVHQGVRIEDHLNRNAYYA